MKNDTFKRLAYSKQVQDFVDNPDFLWKGRITYEELNNLQNYLTEHGIPTPRIPDNKHGEDIKKVMYRVWAGMECLNLMCELCGVGYYECK